MLRMLTAYTTEIDEIDDALEDIFKQINMGSLGKQSVGLICCHYEFVESGVVRALCERLPFDVIGMTTISMASKDYCGVYGLSLSVLTSDEAEFATSFTKPLSENDYDEKISDAYREACGRLPGAPAFIITFLPFTKKLSGSRLVNSFDKICDGIPIFGSVSFGTNAGYENSRTIWNGDAGEENLAMLLIHGAVRPEFSAISLPEHNIRENRAVVTESEGPLLKKVNNMLMSEYLESIGFAFHKGSPLLVYYPGSVNPVALGMYAINSDGSALCGGEIPVGASIAIGEVNRAGVLETAAQSLDKIIGGDRKNGAFIFPCTARYFTLFPDKDEEMKIVSETLNGMMPYILSYSGGEVCPVSSEDGKLHNRFHSFTFCSCVF